MNITKVPEDIVASSISKIGGPEAAEYCEQTYRNACESFRDFAIASDKGKPVGTDTGGLVSACMTGTFDAMVQATLALRFPKHENLTDIPAEDVIKCAFDVAQSLFISFQNNYTGPVKETPNDELSA